MKAEEKPSFSPSLATCFGGMWDRTEIWLLRSDRSAVYVKSSSIIVELKSEESYGEWSAIQYDSYASPSVRAGESLPVG